VVEGTVGGYFESRRVERAIDRLDGHYILCGYGRVGREIAEEFTAEGMRFVVVDRDPATVEECVGEGRPALAGDARPGDSSPP
jgi:voltage-gated potassium channel